MGRTASQVIRQLEARVARLERQARIPDSIMNWDDPKNYNHPAMKAVRGLTGESVNGYKLEESFSGASMWTKGDDDIYVTYDRRQNTFIFNREDEEGGDVVVGISNKE